MNLDLDPGGALIHPLLDKPAKCIEAALEEVLFFGVVRVESRPPHVRTFGDLRNGDRVEPLVEDQLDEGFEQRAVSFERDDRCWPWLRPIMLVSANTV